MDIELKLYKDAQDYALEQINKLDYPDNHPFLEYPGTPNSRSLEYIILLKLMLCNESEIITNLLRKCRSKQNGKFSHIRFVENLDEVLILYYVLVENFQNISNVIYEPKGFIDNNKTLEYSIFYNRSENCIINFEVKTMLCDPFLKEEKLLKKDGTVLIKKLINDEEDFEGILSLFPNAIELKNSTYYSALNRNIKKIVEKYDGKKTLNCRMINIGFICIHFSTSMEEFYTYLFHKKKGIYYSVNWGNLDALVLFLCDAKNDIKLENIYRMGYVETILLNDDEVVKKYLRELRLDNYVLMGKKISKDILEQAQKSYALYKIMNREGFLNIIPYESSEEKICGYVKYLKGQKVRYGDTIE